VEKEDVDANPGADAGTDVKIGLPSEDVGAELGRRA
jgi:hypothetical protein